MKIDIRSKNSVYIELNGWTYCIDDSTGEQIVEKWETTFNICGYCVEDKEVK